MFSGGDFADVVMGSARVHGIAVFWVFALSHHDRRSTLQPMGFRSPNPSEIPLPDIALMIIKRELISSRRRERVERDYGLLVSSLPISFHPQIVIRARSPNQIRIRIQLHHTLTLARPGVKSRHPGTYLHVSALFCIRDSLRPQYNNRLGRSAKKRKKTMRFPPAASQSPLGKRNQLPSHEHASELWLARFLNRPRTRDCSGQARSGQVRRALCVRLSG